uniref:Uncharacterized protein n=1 Tax=Setaria viridis TaxID=4556 RepID=A0A4U6U8G9_SETVI|nr:hypothetical protein SEVIR_7G246651v2 [Setaria viridis]
MAALLSSCTLLPFAPFHAAPHAIVSRCHRQARRGLPPSLPPPLPQHPSRSPPCVTGDFLVSGHGGAVCRTGRGSGAGQAERVLFLLICVLFPFGFGGKRLLFVHYG